MNDEPFRLPEHIHKVLAQLSPHEEKILRMRFGIGEERSYTIDEIAFWFSEPSTHIREIEARAHRKLQQLARPHSLSLST